MAAVPRVAIAAALIWAGLASSAAAADSVTVLLNEERVGLGQLTSIVAHVEADAGFGGGHVSFKYRPASSACAASAQADDGSDASDGMFTPVDPGAGSSDVGGQDLVFELGGWRICAWLVDDATGATVASGSAILTVVPYLGSVAVRVKKLKQGHRFDVDYTSSSASRLYAAVIRGKRCPRVAGKAPRKAAWLTAKAGDRVGGDYGDGTLTARKTFKPGRWVACAWIQDAPKLAPAKAGPAKKTFSVPSRRGARAAAP